MAKINEYPLIEEFTGSEILLVETPEGTRTVNYNQLVALIIQLHNENLGVDISAAVVEAINNGDVSIGEMGVDITDAAMVNCYDVFDGYEIDGNVISFVCQAGMQYAFSGYADKVVYTSDEDIKEEELTGAIERLDHYLLDTSEVDQTITITLTEAMIEYGYELSIVSSVADKLAELEGSTYEDGNEVEY